jgi:probable selenium-dependent hydroxylase accessory protein YqeC
VIYLGFEFCNLGFGQFLFLILRNRSMVSLREGLMLGEGGVISLVGAGGKTSLMYKLAHELAMAGESVLTTTTTKIYEPLPEQSTNLIIGGSLSRMLDKAQEALRNHHHITAAVEKIADQRKLRGFTPEVVQEIWNSHLFRWILVEADGAAGRPLKAPAEHEPVIPACTSQLVGMVGLNGVGQPLTGQWVFREERFAQLTGLAHGSDITEAAIIAVLLHKKGIFKNAPAGIARIVFCNQADVPQNFAAGQRIGRALMEKKPAGLNRVVIGQTLFDPPVIEVYDLKAEPGYDA